MNILELITRDGFTFKRVAASHGGEYAGPCPWCGGNDRFLVWPRHKGGRYWCRGCQRTGDVVQYVRDLHNFTFYEALQFLGIEKHRRKNNRPARAVSMAFNPSIYPPPPDIWTEKAARFLNCTQERLWSIDGRAALGFLHKKGLAEQTIRAAGFGFNAGENGKDIYRHQNKWGLPDEVTRDGRPLSLWFPIGIVIPLQTEGRILRLRIRRDATEGPRYVVVKGSSIAPLPLPPSPNTAGGTANSKSFDVFFTIVESELDAYLVWQEAGDVTSVIAMGSTTIRPDAETHARLIKSEKILNAMDYDQAGAGTMKWWAETYGEKVIRWPVPVGKDPSDAWQKGLNIRDWIEAALSG